MTTPSPSSGTRAQRRSSPRSAVEGLRSPKLNPRRMTSSHDVDPAPRAWRSSQPGIGGKERAVEDLCERHLESIPCPHRPFQIPDSAQELSMSEPLARPVPEVLDGLTGRRGIQAPEEVVPPDD